MDPISALGLTSAIFQIIDFSSKLISGAAHVYSSASGTTAEFDDSDRAIESLKNLTRRLDVRTTGGPLSSEDRSLLEIKRGCEELSRDIQAVINSTRSRNTGSKRASVVASWRVMRRKGKLKTLEERLHGYRAQALEHFLATMSDDLSNTNKVLEALTQEQAQYSQTTRSEIRQMKTDITTVIREAQARQGHHSGGMPSDNLALLPVIQESLTKLIKATEVVNQEDVILQRLWFTELGGRERTVEMPHEQTFRWLLYDSELQLPDSRDSDEETRYPWRVTTESMNSELQLSDSRDSIGEIRHPGRVSTESMSPDQHFFSDQNAGSHDNDDAISFHTAPDENGNGAPDDLGHVQLQSESYHFENLSTRWLNEKEWREQKEKEMRDQKRDSFLSWLRTDSGIFYCSGKAGSGKSTLMKFLGLHNKTKDELSLWSRAEGKTLILASFFFWTSGTRLQRSLEGLYREILWEILRKFPSLIPVVFPAAWSSASVVNPSMAHQPFTLDELESAIDHLFCEEAVTSSHRLCLFIDGLDEYEGDYWKLSRAISRWAASSKDIKFCLSSRPHRVFLQHFALEDKKHLRLHELTRRDMYQFVSDQFRQDERFTVIEHDIRREIDLIEAVVDRSDGVFLWVRLVTMELLTGMGNDCSIRQLIKKLYSIPVGLGNMFQQMLDSIDTLEQQRAAEMFLTMTMSAKFVILSRIVFMQAVLDDLADDPRLADSLLSGTVEPYLSPGECVRKCHVAGSRAIARCKGLVEVTNTGLDFPECHRLSFVHRTVGDFFKDTDIQSRLKIRAGDFCPPRRLCHAALGCFKFIKPDMNESLECPAYEPHRRPGSATVKETVTPRLIIHRDNVGITRGQHLLINTLLGSIRCAEEDGISDLAVELESMTFMLLQAATKSHKGGSTCHFPKLLFSLYTRGINLSWQWQSGPIATNLRCLYSAVISYGMCNFDITETVFELASRHPDIFILSSENYHILLSAALEDLGNAFYGAQDVKMTPILIEQASSSINGEWSERCKIERTHHHEDYEVMTLGPRVSTWSAFLLALSQLWRTRKPGTKSNLAGISTLLELFLQHGADPTVVFIGYSFPTPTDDAASPQPKGPLYIDLLGMIMLWRLVPTDVTLNMLSVARQQQRRGWLHRSLKDFPWVGRQTPDPFERMSALDDTIGGHFLPLSIIPYGSLADIPWEALHETATWASKHGSDDVYFSIET